MADYTACRLSYRQTGGLNFRRMLYSGADSVSISTTVAAPARVPRSATAIYVLWMTLLDEHIAKISCTDTGKSALSGSNAFTMPIEVAFYAAVS